jgi:predicted nuclease of restriction endonuclease-like (RecB) superfamily
MIGSIDCLVGRQQRKNENDQLLVIDRILGLIRKSNYLTREVKTGTDFYEYSG